MTAAYLPPTVYVSHPIKGKTEDDIAILEGLGQAWAASRGMEALLPRTIEPWRHEGPCPTTSNGNGGAADEAEHSHGCYMRGDLVAMLTEADAILMMPGWEQSNGAKAELSTALVVGMPVHFYAASS